MSFKFMCVKAEEWILLAIFCMQNQSGGDLLHIRYTSSLCKPPGHTFSHAFRSTHHSHHTHTSLLWQEPCLSVLLFSHMSLEDLRNSLYVLLSWLFLLAVLHPLFTVIALPLYPPFSPWVTLIPPDFLYSHVISDSVFQIGWPLRCRYFVT